MSDVNMMNEPLENIAERVRKTKDAMAQTEVLIKAMRDAGENVSDLESTYRAQQIRLGRWEKMLTDRGIEV